MKTISYFLILLWVTLGLAPLQAEEVLKVGAVDFPPFYVVESHEKVTGLLVNLQRQVLNELGYKYKVIGYSPERLYHNLADGKVQIWLGLPNTPLYRGKVHISKTHVAETILKAYYLKGQKPIRNFKDLKGQKVITIRGFGYAGIKDRLMKEIDIHPLEAPSHEAAFRMLKKQRAPYLLNYHRPVTDALTREPVENLESNVLQKIKVYFIVSKKLKEGKKLLKDMEGAYLRLKKAGKVPSW